MSSWAWTATLADSKGQAEAGRVKATDVGVYRAARRWLDAYHGRTLTRAG